MKDHTITAVWANLDEFLKSGKNVEIPAGTLLFDINSSQAYGLYLSHDKQYVQLSNSNVDYLGFLHSVPRCAIMINLLWLQNQN